MSSPRAEQEDSAGSAGPADPVATTAPVVRAIDGLSVGTGWLGAAMLAAMLAMICFDVIMRYAFNAPTTWATEISTYTLVAIAFLGTAYTHRVDGHIQVEILLNALAPERRRRLSLIAAWIGLAFVAFTAWQAVLLAHDNYVNGTRAFSLLYTPIYLPQIPIAIGFIVFAVAFLAEIHRLSPPPARWREWAVPVLLLLAIVALWGLGPRPATAFGTPFDWGSIVIAAALAAAAVSWSGWRTALWTIGLLAIAAAAFAAVRGSPVGVIVAIQAVLTMALLALGVRVGLALGMVGLLGIYFLLPSPVPITLAERSWDSTNSFTLTAVPMFVLMGTLLLRSGLSEQVFDALVKWTGRVPGGLAHAGIGACTIFAAVSGSSVATAATLGMVACPEMVKRGYSPRLAYGSIAAGGTLGILIPPSIAMIIYGSTVGASIAILFIAGIIPGLMLTLFFMAVVLVWSLADPRAAPRSERFGWRDRFLSLWQILPIALLIVAVLGVLYAGVATPTEAGALGAAAALIICVARRRLDFGGLVEVLLETVKVTSFLFVIIVGASILTYSFDFLRLPQQLVELVRGASAEPWQVMLAISALYVVLGMFVDSISMMVMTLPVLFPLVVEMGFDPIWFGVVLVILMEVGLVTPPVGMNLFVLRGVGDASIKDISIGAIPFVVALLLSLLLLYWIPGLATWLPAGME